MRQLTKVEQVHKQLEQLIKCNFTVFTCVLVPSEIFEIWYSSAEENCVLLDHLLLLLTRLVIRW